MYQNYVIPVNNLSACQKELTENKIWNCGVWKNRSIFLGIKAKSTPKTAEIIKKYAK